MHIPFKNLLHKATDSDILKKIEYQDILSMWIIKQILNYNSGKRDLEQYFDFHVTVIFKGNLHDSTE